MLATYREFLKMLTVDQLNKLMDELNKGELCRRHFYTLGNGLQILRGCAFAAPFIGENFQAYCMNTLPMIQQRVGHDEFWKCITEFDKMPLSESIPLLQEWTQAELATR